MNYQESLTEYVFLQRLIDGYNDQLTQTALELRNPKNAGNIHLLSKQRDLRQKLDKLFAPFRIVVNDVIKGMEKKYDVNLQEFLNVPKDKNGKVLSIKKEKSR